jgi:hypothetical protein
MDCKNGVQMNKLKTFSTTPQGAAEKPDVFKMK